MSRPSSILRALLVAAGAAALGLLQACVATSPDTDARFGQATHELLVQQRNDPDASRKNGQAQPPADGRTVRGNRDRVDSGSSSGPTLRGLGALMSGGADN